MIISSKVSKYGGCRVKCLLREIDGNGGVLIGPMMLSTFGTCLTSDGSGRVSGELRSTT